MKVILISGKAGHGKDTLAGFLKKEMEKDGKRVLITHYADLLKYICKTFLDWDGKKNESGRRLLQVVGTDVVRRLYPDFWVDFIISVLQIFQDRWDYVLIPDARFPNEITKIRKQFDCTHIKVIRHACESALTDDQRRHASETALDDFCPDYTFDNHEDGLRNFRDIVRIYYREYLSQGK